MPKDTKTRYQGIYARHRLDCAVEQDRTCNCSPSYWGRVWDRVDTKHRKTKKVRTVAEARSARTDLQATLRAGRVPDIELDARLDRNRGVSQRDRGG